MRKLNGGTNLDKKFQPFIDGKLVFLAILIDGRSLDQLHDQERKPFRSGAAIVQARNVWVIQ